MEPLKASDSTLMPLTRSSTMNRRVKTLFPPWLTMWNAYIILKKLMRIILKKMIQKIVIATFVENECGIKKSFSVWKPLGARFETWSRKFIAILCQILPVPVKNRMWRGWRTRSGSCSGEILINFFRGWRPLSKRPFWNKKSNLSNYWKAKPKIHP